MSSAHLNRQQASESVWTSLMNKPRPAFEDLTKAPRVGGRERKKDLTKPPSVGGRERKKDLTKAPRVGGRERKKTATRKTKQDTCDLITT